MTKKTISKMVMGVGFGALAGAITYKLIKDHKNIKAMNKLLMEEDYLVEETEQEEDLLTHEDMVSKRKYIKIR